MRILHVAEDYPRGRRLDAVDPRVVAARQVASLATRQAVRGDIVHVVTRYLSEGWTCTEPSGVRVHRLPGSSRWLVHLARAIRLVRPEVVHFHGLAPARGAPAGRAPAGRAPAGRAPAGRAPAGRAPCVRTDWAVDLPLGVDLAPWIAAGTKRDGASGVLFHAGDRTRQTPSPGFPVTAIGPAAALVPDADVILGDAPDEVFAALAADHDVYVSAASLDPHLAGAHAAGMKVLPTAVNPADHDWEAVLAHVDSLYAAAIR